MNDIATKDSPGQFDGMERAKPGEPVFTLRAHDILAAPLVFDWVERKRAIIRAATEHEDEGKRMSPAKRQLELEQVRDAENIALEMIEWRRVKREPETVDELVAQPAYTGREPSRAEVRQKEQLAAMKEATARLDNAAASISDAIDALPRGTGAIKDELRALLKSVQTKADAIRPKRGR